MKTQKFAAPTMREVLAKVKEELGEDAVIIKSQKTQAGGGLNFLKRELIEVVAAMPDDVKAELQTGPEFAETLENTMDSPEPQKRAGRASYEVALLRDEVSRIRDDLEQIGKYFRYNNLPSMPQELTRVWEAMSTSGLDREWATDLAQDALVNLDASELISADAISDYMLRQLSRIVPPPPENRPIRSREPYKIALVGPPGAGKTTTLQKLATDPIAFGKRKVGLISFDTHRLAAIEQIRSFARVAGAPIEIIYKVEQVDDALTRLSDCEIILIDTAGCPPDQRERIAQLEGFIEAADPDETHLVLNSCVRDDELVHATRRYRDLNVSHLCFTRLDESLKNGYLLNVTRLSGKPIAWLGDGQSFTGDLHRVSSNDVQQWILSHEPAARMAAQLEAVAAR